MLVYVISKLEEALDQRSKKSLGSAQILLLGISYKKISLMFEKALL